jgi:hypothetical protein
LDFKAVASLESAPFELRVCVEKDREIVNPKNRCTFMGSSHVGRVVISLEKLRQEGGNANDKPTKIPRKLKRRT